MRDYGKVHVSFWSSPTLAALDSDGKLLALYLLTSPHTNMVGCFRLPDAYACEDLKWDAKRLRNGFATLSTAKFAERDEQTCWTFIVAFSKWNRPENPNQRKAAEKLLLSMPDSLSFKSLALSSFGFSPEFGGTVAERFQNSPVPVPVPVPVQEQQNFVEKIPLRDGTDFGVTDSFVAEMKRAYPRIDVEAELAKARVWSLANEDQRKTRRGVKKFITGWIGRAAPQVKSKVDSIRELT